MSALEGKREQQPRGSDGNRKSSDAAGNGERGALRERLYDDLPPAGAKGQANRGLSPPRHSASQQQVRHIGAYDQQYQAANREKDLEAAPILLFHLGDAGSRRHQVDNLF